MYDLAYYQRVEASIAKAREALTAYGDYTLGTITVKLTDQNSDDWHKPYVRAECAKCGAHCVMAASRWQDMRSLALSLAYDPCKRNGHVQDYAALLAASRTEEERREDSEV